MLVTECMVRGHRRRAVNSDPCPQPDPPLRVSLPPTSPSGLHLPSPISDLRPLASDFRPPYLANSLVTTDKSELTDLIGTTNKSELPDLIGATDKSELPDE